MNSLLKKTKKKTLWQAIPLPHSSETQWSVFPDIYRCTPNWTQVNYVKIPWHPLIVLCMQQLSLSPNHRMTWVARDPMDVQVPSTLPQAGLPAARSRGPGPPLQGQGIHISAQPVPAPHQSLSKKLPPISNLNLPSFNLKPLPLFLSLSTYVKLISLTFINSL